MAMITSEFVSVINSAICEDNGWSSSPCINPNNLEYALSVQQWYDIDELLAFALVRSIVMEHPFPDGNKRTAACIGNYVKHFRCSDRELIQCILDVCEGSLRDVENIADRLYGSSK